jgi:hypothetical protein
MAKRKANHMNNSISIRSVARRTIATYAGQASVLLPVAAITVVIVVALDASPIKDSVVLAIGALIVWVAVIALFTGVVVRRASDSWEGRPAASPRELLASVRPVLGELILVGFAANIAITFSYSVASLLFLALAVGAVVGVGINVGSIVVVAVLGAILLLAPGTYLLTVWSVAVPVVVLERPGGLRALGRSSDLARDSRWRVCGVVVLFFVILGVCIRALELAGHAAGHGPGLAAQLLAATLIAPIPLLGATALYFELRRVAATDPPRMATPPYSPVDTSPPGAEGGVA